jgi:hypothetical protein
MSGWDASSRPAWDPQGGEGESTQSFGVPDSWNSPQEPPEGGGFPASGSPGTPPDIFLQDYDSSDFAPSDFAPSDFAPSDFAPNSVAQNGVGRHAAPQHRDNGRRDNGHRDNAHRGRGRQDPLPRDPAPWDSPEQDYPSRGYRGPDLPQRPQRPDRTERPERSERPERFDGPDPRDRDYPDPLGYRDSEQAARVDPALRDFFAPPPDRPEAGRLAPGQPRHGVSGYGAAGNGASGYGPAGYGAAGYGDSRYGESGYGSQSRDPWEPAPDDRDQHREAPPRRPGSHSGHRQEAPPRRSGVTALVAVAVVVVIGIGVGAYLLLNRGNSTAPQSTGGTTAAPTSSPQPQLTNRAAPPAKTVTYTLTTPATAGGYSALSKIPTALMNAASTTTAAMSGPALSDGGGKIAGKGVAAAYQLSSGQVMTFIGYEGTFNPAKVLSNLASLGSSGKQYPAGPHGGDLACATAPGTPSGTVCLWTTTTTLAVTEFFAADDSPEVVADQSKAAADTLKLRNSVEVPK